MVVSLHRTEEVLLAVLDIVVIPREVDAESYLERLFGIIFLLIGVPSLVLSPTTSCSRHFE